MDVTAKVELVFAGTEDELVRAARAAASIRADVRWRTGEGDHAELRVRLPADHVGAVVETLKRVVPPEMLPSW